MVINNCVNALPLREGSRFPLNYCAEKGVTQAFPLNQTMARVGGEKLKRAPSRAERISDLGGLRHGAIVADFDVKARSFQRPAAYKRFAHQLHVHSSQRS